MPEGAGLEARNVAGAMTSMHIDELISNLAIGIAQGQMQLDQVCMEIAQFMGDAQVAFGKRAGSDEPDLLSLIELGFSPNFYQFVDTILEVRVSVSTQFEESREYDTSQTQMHQDEYQSQSSYESRSSQTSSGYSYGYSGYYGWWWWGRRYGYGGSRYGSSSSRSASSSSLKQKNVSLTTVDAKYASTYNYAVEGSSLVKTKIVPVPPPQVFEEIVRAKVQERREWEQRMRWTDQARSILTAAANTAYSTISDGEGLGKSLITFKRDNAVKVRDPVLNLQDEYNQMTTDHWAVIKNSVRLREAADNELESIVENTRKLVDAFPEDGTSPDDSTVVKNLLTALKNSLESFKGQIEELLEKIPAQEEETAKETTVETREQETGEGGTDSGTDNSGT
jgi:hypothetical protein